ncbi:MAG: prolyl aminopeptidase [Chloroflexota bacterium]
MFPEIEPSERGFLNVDESNQIYWEICGNPQGKPVVVLHGGPGSGCTMWHRRLFDPDFYHIVLFDQRNCGRSLPHASDMDTGLDENMTQNLVADVEKLRQYMAIDRWLVFGGSWGSTLALAYAERHPDRVIEMVLFGITTGRHTEIDWLFRGGADRFFPAQWERLCNALPMSERNGDIVEAYYRRLNDINLSVRQKAASDWCLWESATIDWPPVETLSKRFENPRFALAFARIVTHYMRHNLWLDDGILLHNINALYGIPGILVNGRFDFQSPIGNAWELHRAWPQSKLVIVDNAGHAATDSALIDATNIFKK